MKVKSFFLFMFSLTGALLPEIATARPVVLFSGGFGSCAVMGSTSEIKSSEEMDHFVDRMRGVTGEDPLEIRTCYALGSESTIYVTASELGIVDYGMTRDDFHNVVRDAARLAGDRAPVYLWGQSHGGWTVMNLVYQVSELNYRLLTTVDPISVAECGPVVFSGGVLTGSAEGCRRAPADLESVYSLIAEKVSLWVNWYQLEFSLLHSSAIPQANQNIQRNFSAPWWTPMGAHSMTERDPVMWKKTTELAEFDASKSNQVSENGNP